MPGNGPAPTDRPTPPPPPPYRRLDADAPWLGQIREMRAEGAERFRDGEQAEQEKPGALPFSVDMNDRVRVRLTPSGLQVYRERYFRDPSPDDDGYIALQLWQLMRVFGPHIHLAADPVFDGPIVVGPDF